MKKIIPSFVMQFNQLLFFVLLVFTGGSIKAQTQLYFQNFNTGTAPEWTLNSAVLGGKTATTAASDNYWFIGNAYKGCCLGIIIATPNEPAGVVGEPQSYYMHITNGNNNGITNDFNANFEAPATGAYVASMNKPIVATGYSAVTLSFYYLCNGGAKYYGQLYYSLNGGTTWVQEGADYEGVASWTLATVTDPAWTNAASLEFAFVWSENGGSAGNDPPWAVDDIKVVGTGTPCAVKITNQASTNPTCSNPTGGSITITASDTAVGSVLEYHISKGSLVDSNKTGIFTGLDTGTYNITVSSDSCAVDGTPIVISLPAGPALVTTGVTITNPSCTLPNSGSITGLSANGGSTPYASEVWKNGGGTPVSATFNLTNQPAGTYTFTLTDNAGCTTDTTLTLTAPVGPKLAGTLTITEPTCGNSNGGASGWTISGGAAPITAAWKNGGTTISNTTSFSGQPGGTYTLTVTDNAGCSVDSTITLTNVPGPQFVTTGVVITGPTCSLPNGGSITGLQVSDATPDSSTVWTNSSGTTVSSVFDLTSQPGGTYTFTFIDKSGCEIDTPFTLNTPAGLVVNGTLKITEPTCGASNGAVSGWNITGGTQPYTYVWKSNGTTITSDTTSFMGQSSGTYNLTVTDVNSCSVDTSVSLSNAGGPQLSGTLKISDPTCGRTNGSVSGWVVTGGTSPYNYVWTINGDTIVSDTTSFTNQGGGTYNLVVTDGTGCMKDSVVTLTNITGPQLSGNLTITQPTCGKSNGSVTGWNATGGTPPYTESWTKNGTSVSDSFGFVNQPAGNYTFVVMDSNGCSTADSTITLVAPGSPVLDTTGLAVTEPTCDASNGSVSGLTASGGSLPYAEVWTNSSSMTISDTFTFSNQPSGKYYFTLTDNAGCIASYTLTLAALNAPGFLTNNLEITNPSCGNANGSILGLQVSGGATPYASEVWTDSATAGIVSTTLSLDSQPGGTFIFTVTDNSGCHVDTSITLVATGAATPPLIAITNGKDSICSSGDTAQICVSNSNLYVAYLWSNNGTASCIATNIPGQCYVTGTDTNGCKAISNVLNIGVKQSPSISTSQSGDTLECYDILSCQWFYNGVAIPAPQGTDSIYIATAKGEYTVLITGANGCTALSSQILDTVIAGINNISALVQFDIFPNPATEGVLELKNPAQLIGLQYRIFDVTGKLVYSSIIRNEQNEINIATFSNGVYLLKVGDVMKQFVKQ